MSDDQYRFRFDAKKPKKKKSKKLGQFGGLPKPEPPEPAARTCEPEQAASLAAPEPRRKVLDWVRGRAVPYVASVPARSADKAVIDTGSLLIIGVAGAVLTFVGVQTGLIPWPASSSSQNQPAPSKPDPWEPKIRKH